MSAGLGLRSNRPLIAVERRAALLPAWTAATIVAGVTALGFVTVFGTLAGPIAVPMVAEAWARPVGVLLWTLFGLAGSTRILRGPSGHGVLTFHLPFIVAAMVLGGPIAGGWVAFLSSIERRQPVPLEWRMPTSRGPRSRGLALVGAVQGPSRCR